MEASAQSVASVDFTSGVPEGWVAECSNIDLAGESCDIEETAAGVRLSAVASCFSPPFNGARSHLTNVFDLPEGNYRVIGSSELFAEHTDFCSGGGGGRIGVTQDLEPLITEVCMAPECTTCTLPVTRTEECVSHAGGELQLGIFVAAGDCSEGYSDISSFEIIKVADCDETSGTSDGEGSDEGCSTLTPTSAPASPLAALLALCAGALLLRRRR